MPRNSLSLPSEDVPNLGALTKLLQEVNDLICKEERKGKEYIYGVSISPTGKGNVVIFDVASAEPIPPILREFPSTLSDEQLALETMKIEDAERLLLSSAYDFNFVNGPQSEVKVVALFYPTAVPAAGTSSVTFRGKMSTFGGFGDTGMTKDEDLAWIEKEAQASGYAGFFNPQKEGEGFAWRLRKDDVPYIACRWDYDVTPKSYLAKPTTLATVTNVLTGRSIQARPIDWGPHEQETGRAADLSPFVAAKLGLRTDDVVEVVLPKPPGPAAHVAPATVTKPLPTGANPFLIDSDHWLVGAQREPLAGGRPMSTCRFLVVHFTSGATAKSSIDFWRTPAADGASAHVVIDRDGTVYQCRPFDTTCGHAGKSTFKGVSPSLNSCSIGIELANAGDDTRLAKRFTKLPLVRAPHKNGGSTVEWEDYPQAQLQACEAVSRALVARYKLEAVVGHDDIAPNRKNDPGPAFPLAALRTACGLTA